MIDFLKLSDTDLMISSRGLRDEFRRRGWAATVPYAGSSHIFLDRGDRKTIHLFSIMPPNISSASNLLAKNKFATYQVVKYNAPEILQPATILTQDLADAEEFLSRHRKVVVKPVDSGHGNGITVSVVDRDGLHKAMEYARTHSGGNAKVLIQQMVEGSLQDLRLAIVGGKFVAAINRVPARVTGDGKHTVGELIKIENGTFRGKAYFAKLAVIDEQRAQEYLGDKFGFVPSEKETVAVMGVANYGQGGELIDVTDAIPQWMADAAEKVAFVTGLPVCGVDFLINAPLDDSLSLNQAYLVEINAVPSLAIHDRPTVGRNRHVIMKLCDYLETI